MEWNPSSGTSALPSRESPFRVGEESTQSQHSPFGGEEFFNESTFDAPRNGVQESAPVYSNGGETQADASEAIMREDEEAPFGGGWLRSPEARGSETYSGTGQLFHYSQMEFDSPQPGALRVVNIVKVWPRPPFPSGLKNGIIARAVVRVLTKDLLGWFIHVNFPNPWFRRLDADLTELVPEVDLTIEVFKELKAGMTNDEMMDSVKRYLELRHLTDLTATRYWVGHVYSIRATDLPDKLGINLDPLLTAAKVKGIPLSEVDKYFLAVYASFPTGIETSMLPEHQEVLREFVSGSWGLNADHIDQIKQIAQRIKASDSTPQAIRTVRLMGHADPVPIAGGNVRLGWQRGLSVRDQLIHELEDAQPGLSKKISFFVESLGEGSPSSSNSTEAGRAQNRRVEVFTSALGKGTSVTGHIHRVPIEDVSKRGLGLLKQSRFNLGPVEVDVLSCLLRKVLPDDADDRYVDGNLVRMVWDTGHPRPQWFSLKGALTVKDAFGPDVSDDDFIRRLKQWNDWIVQGMDVVNQITGTQGGATSRGIEALKQWMADQMKNDNSVYSCYKDI
jgi:OmpA family